MQNRNRWLRVLGFAGLLLGFDPIAAMPPYEITDLGVLPGGGDASMSSGVNNLGVVVGRSWSQGFVWKDGAMTGLGCLPGGYASSAGAVNDAGQVVGYAATDGGGVNQPFLWTQGAGMTNLGSLMGCSEGAAMDINSEGHVIGTGRFQGQERAYIWSTGVGTQFLNWTDDRILPRGINDSGQIVGAEATGNAFIYDKNAGVSYILPPAPFDEADAGCIAENGLVVGSLTDRDTNTATGFILDGEGMTILAPLDGFHIAYARKVNVAGVVIGVCYVGGDPDTSTATLWAQGQAFALSSLLEDEPGWVLRSADDINESGQIVGWGVNPEGVQRAFLLTPVPEPTSLGLLALGGLAFVRRRRPPCKG